MAVLYSAGNGYTKAEVDRQCSEMAIRLADAGNHHETMKLLPFVPSSRNFQGRG